MLVKNTDPRLREGKRNPRGKATSSMVMTVWNSQEKIRRRHTRTGIRTAKSPEEVRSGQKKSGVQIAGRKASGKAEDTLASMSPGGKC